MRNDFILFGISGKKTSYITNTTIFVIYEPCAAETGNVISVGGKGAENMHRDGLIKLFRNFKVGTYFRKFEIPKELRPYPICKILYGIPLRI